MPFKDREKHREQIRAIGRANYRKHIEKFRKKRRLYYLNNKEKEHKRFREWVFKNREYRREYMNKYSLEHKPQAAQWYWKNKKRIQEKNKKNVYHRRLLQVKIKYGLTKEQYESMLRVQENRCAICKEPFGQTRSVLPHVDHCHKTNKTRGLLCHNCNIMIGSGRDNVDILQEGIMYLKKYNYNQMLKEQEERK